MYLVSQISSTERDVNIFLTKALNAFERLLIKWKSDKSQKIKWDFFQVVAASILAYEWTTWTPRKCMQNKFMGTTQWCCVLCWKNPERNNPQNNICIATWLPYTSHLRNHINKNEEDILSTVGLAKMNPWAKFSHGLLTVDVPVLVDQQRLICVKYKQTEDAAKRTYQEQLKIGIFCEREREKEGGRESVCVCVCVGVRERKRESETLRCQIDLIMIIYIYIYIYIYLEFCYTVSFLFLFVTGERKDCPSQNKGACCLHFVHCSFLPAFKTIHRDRERRETEWDRVRQRKRQRDKVYKQWKVFALNFELCFVFPSLPTIRITDILVVTDHPEGIYLEALFTQQTVRKITVTTYRNYDHVDPFENQAVIACRPFLSTSGIKWHLSKVSTTLRSA